MKSKAKGVCPNCLRDGLASAAYGVCGRCVYRLNGLSGRALLEALPASRSDDQPMKKMVSKPVEPALSQVKPDNAKQPVLADDIRENLLHEAKAQAAEEWDEIAEMLRLHGIDDRQVEVAGWHFKSGFVAGAAFGFEIG